MICLWIFGPRIVFWIFAVFGVGFLALGSRHCFFGPLGLFARGVLGSSFSSLGIFDLSNLQFWVFFR